PLETATGRTFGKWITGTIVIHEDNDKPDFGQIIVRTICRMIPFEVFSFLGGNPQGWHDRFSRTKVVDIGDLRG
ncbi:MAG: RDD family protein, partial [bacterium]